MKKTYTSKDIRVLEGLEAVRVRPGMYIGSTGSQGLHHLAEEMIDNAVDEALAGACTEIIVTLYDKKRLSVKDNGRGLPVDLMPSSRDFPKEVYPKGISAERVLLTTLHSGGKFEKEDSSYAISGGLHGVGLAVVNALSSEVIVESWKDGFYYKDTYEKGGKPTTNLAGGELLPLSKTKETGTCITFTPDETIFDDTVFKAEVLLKRLQEVAFLNAGLKMIFREHLEGQLNEQCFLETDGSKGYVRALTKDKKPLYEPIFIDGIHQKMQLSCAFVSVEEEGEWVASFCNNIHTFDGGTHVTGFKTGLTKLVNRYAKELGLLKGDQTLDGKDVRSGLAVVLSFKHPNPQFDGQTKRKLGSTDAKAASEAICLKVLEHTFDRNIQTATLFIEKAVKAYEKRKKEAKQKESALSKLAPLSSSKLSSCQLKNNPAKGILTELYLVEGDSAGGSAKQGRNRQFQAILPLRGKILNCEKAVLSKIFDNEEIRSMVQAFGCGFDENQGQDLHLETLCYSKIIIMTDADVDGAHIRTLLLTFFYNFYRPLIEKGYIYVAQPPLYKLTTGRGKQQKSQYLYSEKALKAHLKKIKDTPYILQRFKGLGEMNPSQLWETTMDPETRTLLRVTLEDGLNAKAITEALMGNDSKSRKNFIEAASVDATIDC